MRCWYIMDNTKHFGIHIDIIENEVYKGFEFFSFERLFKNVERYNGFFILNKTMDTMMLLVQNIVAYKSLKDKYRTTIAKNYTQFKYEIDKEIINFWGKQEKKCKKIIEERSIFQKLPWKKSFYIITLAENEKNLFETTILYTQWNYKIFFW